MGQEGKTENRASRESVPPWEPSTPVQALPGVGPGRARAFAALGVRTLEDLLLLLPRRYEEWEGLQDPSPPFVGKRVVVQGRVEQASLRHLGGRRSFLRVRVRAGARDIPLEALFFNQAYLTPQFVRGGTFRFQGKLEREGDLYRLRAPKFEKIEEGKKPRLQAEGRGIAPVYPETQGLRSDFISRTITLLLAAGLPEALEPKAPARLAAALGLPPLALSLRRLHRPRPGEILESFRRRIALEEAWMLLGRARRERRERAGLKGPRIVVTPALERRILARLPFAFHPGQVRAWAEIRRDLGRGRPMGRLLQGDVGSGKTALAFAAALACVAKGYQAAFMAPTQVLAAQHARTFSKWLEGSRVRLALFTSGMGRAERRALLGDLEAGRIDIVLGTHALVQEGVRFARLGLAVVDEQHRFGVAQRARLRRGGESPHFLVLSATPIPRTLALTVYGGLDVSRVVGFPPGRIPVETRVLEGGGLEDSFPFMEEALARGGRIFVVFPRIGPPGEEGSLLQGAEILRKRFGKERVALAHGEQKEALREKAFRDFRGGRTPILAATTVVEVGLDVPEATLMVVAGAESFGLSTLHQLRGRVGRGREGGLFLLLAPGENREAAERLRFLERERDGFRVAEEDLRRRGPGEAAGTRQHGSGSFRALRPLQDLDLLEEVRKAQGWRGGLEVEP